MFMFVHDYVNMNIFVTSQVTNLISEPFCKVEPCLRRKFLEEKMRICLEPFFKNTLHFWKIHPPFLCFEGEFR